MSSPQAWDNAMNDLRGATPRDLATAINSGCSSIPRAIRSWRPRRGSGSCSKSARSWIRSGRIRPSTGWSWSATAWAGCSPGWRSATAGRSSGTPRPRSRSSRSSSSPQLKDLLTTALFFEPVPEVSRVVFVSTPHRGSPVGDAFLGRLASRLITVPEDTPTIRKAWCSTTAKGMSPRHSGTGAMRLAWRSSAPRTRSSRWSIACRSANPWPTTRSWDTTARIRCRRVTASSRTPAPTWITPCPSSSSPSPFGPGAAAVDPGDATDPQAPRAGIRHRTGSTGPRRQASPPDHPGPGPPRHPIRPHPGESRPALLPLGLSRADTPLDLRLIR